MATYYTALSANSFVMSGRGKKKTYTLLLYIYDYYTVQTVSMRGLHAATYDFTLEPAQSTAAPIGSQKLYSRRMGIPYILVCPIRIDSRAEIPKHIIHHVCIMSPYVYLLEHRGYRSQHGRIWGGGVCRWCLALVNHYRMNTLTPIHTRTAL